MKKLIIILVLGLPVVAYAQRFKGGVVLGLNACQIDGDSLSGYNKAGLTGGAFVYTDFDNKWSAQLELKYSSKGSSSVPKDNSFYHKFRLQYIEMPILAKYKLFKVVELQAGISLGYLFSAKENLEDGSGWINFYRSPNKFETTAFGGINITALDPFCLNVRYSYSIFPIVTPYSGASYGKGAWYNNVITLGIYYHIGSRK
jgi:hypothetical protein